MMRSLKLQALAACSVCAAALLILGCGDDENSHEVGSSGGGGAGSGGSGAAGGAGTGRRTLDNCATNIDADVPAFYATYFHCVDISMDGANVVIRSIDLPPHQSAYYDASDANYLEWDTAGGNMKIPGPINIEQQDIILTILPDPVAKGITIDGTLVDGMLMTSNEELPVGAAGIALDSVAYFSGAAAMGMNIADEAGTFDRYEAHHAMGAYHYHGQTPGPLEVMERAGLIDTTTPGAASIELYAIMCDGTVVLGCTELDGSTPELSGADAQGGHVHDITDGTMTHFAGRYHTHVCPGTGADFSPEIQYYDSCP